MANTVKPIVLKCKDTEYTLEFNRESVKFAEARGFQIENVTNFPMTYIPDLFFYAFRMHHANVARNQVDKILFEELGTLPEGFLLRLMELYTQPFDTLIGTTEEGEERKNSKWTVEM